MHIEHKTDQLNKLAATIKKWDADRHRISHKENHEGAAYREWHNSDDWAVEIVQTVQYILGDAAIAKPVKICPPGQEREDCASADHD